MSFGQDFSSGRVDRRARLLCKHALTITLRTGAISRLTETGHAAGESVVERELVGVGFWGSLVAFAVWRIAHESSNGEGIGVVFLGLYKDSHRVFCQ